MPVAKGKQGSKIAAGKTVAATETTEEGTRKTPARVMPKGVPFSGERAREMGKRAAAKRAEKAESAAKREASVIVPLELEAVITGLRDKAKAGNAQAASALLAYLTRFPVQLGTGEDWADIALEDMTPDQLAFAEAWALRQVNRAMRRAEGMGKAGKQEKEDAHA